MHGSHLSDERLPRLIYVGDVPVERSYHGSQLLYRLLQGYPPSKLLVVEAFDPSREDRRLANVQYRNIAQETPRLLRTRFHKWIAAWLTLTCARHGPALRRIAESFQPEAVLTVGHGFSWQLAAEFAFRNCIPLHLIVHDDWPRMDVVPAAFQGWLNERFEAVYRQAVTRLCVSPHMVELYRELYDRDGIVLYPSRAVDVEQFAEPPERVSRQIDDGLIVAFAGSVIASYRPMLRQVAECLQRKGGKLLIYGPLDSSYAKEIGLDLGNIQICGLLPSRQLIQALREQADVLLLPMSFVEIDRSNMSISFPSKLTDYTTTGLPILIYGPEYCSAVRWAKENPGAAEVVSEDSPMALEAALDRLAKDATYRHALGKGALIAGDRYFSHAAGGRTFMSGLRVHMAGEHADPFSCAQLEPVRD